MNAIAMLKDDHKKVRRLLAQFIAAKGSVARKRFAERALGSDNLAQLAQRMAERKRSLSSPGLLGSTLERAKKLVTDAVEAVSETGAANEKHAPRGGVRRQKTAPSSATNALSSRAKRPRATPTKSTKAEPATRKVGAKAAGKPIAKTKARSTTAPRKAGRRASSRGARAIRH